MRKPFLLLVLIALLLFSVTVFAQDRGSRRRPPQQAPRAEPRRQPAPERRAVPRPPQDYNRNQRSYQRQYHYDGRWSHRAPRPYQKRYRYNRGWRLYTCQPGYVIFIGYNYYGRPVYEFHYGHCNVPWHYHDYYFYDGYR